MTEELISVSAVDVSQRIIATGKSIPVGIVYTFETKTKILTIEQMFYGNPIGTVEVHEKEKSND